MAIPRRGLREIITLSGSVDHVALPYRAFMRITCLEMEKVRRNGEKRSAGQRIADIDARLAEIEAEKHDLLQSIGEINNGRSIIARGLQPKRAGRSGNNGFKMKY